jgi:hypothetical protein
MALLNRISSLQALRSRPLQSWSRDDPASSSRHADLALTRLLGPSDLSRPLGGLRRRSSLLMSRLRLSGARPPRQYLSDSGPPIPFHAILTPSPPPCLANVVNYPYPCPAPFGSARLPLASLLHACGRQMPLQFVKNEKARSSCS